MEVKRVEENKTISTEPNKTDKKKIFAIAGLVLAIVVAVVTNLLPVTDINKVIVIAYVGFGLEVVAVILGIMGLKGNKTVAVIAIVIGAIIGGFTLLGGFGLQIMTKATDCVPSKTEGTYVCKYAGADLEVPGEYLRDDQIKKGE